MNHYERDRLMAVKRARVWTSSNFVILDTETTGLDDMGRIVELSCIDREGTVLVNSLVNPGVPIPPAASVIHGITDVDVADSPHFIDLWPQVWAALRGAERILMYNGSYDSRLIRQSLDGDVGALAQVDTLRYGCMMQLYARFYGAFNEYRGSYTWQRLGQAVNQCGLTWDGTAHRALADTRATLAILNYMAAGPPTLAAAA